MSSNWLKLALVVFLGWTISGPFFMTVDCWDNAHEETQDIARSTGGVVTLLGAAFLAGMVALRKLQERLSSSSRHQTVLKNLFPQSSFTSSFFLPVVLQLSMSMDSSPPSPLRI